MEDHHGLKRASIMFIFVVLRLVQAQDQQGFISLDCGLPPNKSPYTEPKTNLNFSSDAGFIQTGKGGRIANEWDFDYQQYNTLRSFPEGTRHCYNLSVKQGTNYLIRAGFAYGNYDGTNIYPRFDLYIGPNPWRTVYVEYIQEFEIIQMAKSNSLQICLHKTGTTTPFISTLELRPLLNDAYSTQSGSLLLVNRKFYKENLILRYPNDVFDRIWSGVYFWLEDIREINTSLAVNSSSPFRLPEIIARSAGTPVNATESLAFYESGENPSDNIVIYLHFAEIQDLRANDTREFDIVWNDNVTYSAYSPKKLEIKTIFNTVPNKCDYRSCEMELMRTQKSTLPPLLNAYEVYKVMDFPYTETYPDDVTAIKNIKAAYRLNMIDWQGDPCLPEQWKWKRVDCRYTNKYTPPRIISLDLQSMELSGVIVLGFQNLTQLQKLDLSSNKLSGEVPEFLANMKSLSTINIGWNNLTGVIPQALRKRVNKGLKLNFQGNSKLCWTDKCNSNNNNTKSIAPIVASVTSVALVVVVLLLFFSYKKKKTSKVPRRSPITKSSILTKKRKFTYSEVETMTNNFERVIGEGGFGVVYHGFLNDTEQVAIKVLSHSSTQGYKQFKAEVELLLRVHHTNLVSLVGYCNEEDQLALVYEYAAKGDLKQLLSGESSIAFNWASRLRISIEIAQGLEYLHIGCKPPMIHRDVKTTNILLDENLQAKLADFGLSRSFPIGVETHVSTNVAGTPGYLDPEYYRTNWLTEKSDVYSLGIVLLEMITNQPVIQQTREKPHIAEWVGLSLTKGDIESIMDPNLNGEYDSSSVWKALELAMSCVNPSQAGRPNMSQVVIELKECLLHENSKKEGRSDMDSKSSLELSTNFASEVTPDAR